MDAQQTPGYYATRAIATLFTNDAIRQEFMDVYGVDNAAAKTFLVTRLHMPDTMAQAVVDKTGDDLSKFVGGNVCSYLW